MAWAELRTGVKWTLDKCVFPLRYFGSSEGESLNGVSNEDFVFESAEL